MIASLCGEGCPIGARLGARIKPLPPQTQVLSPLLIALPLPHAHLQGTLLPRGFFLGLGLIYLAALAVDRLAANWRLPGAAAVLLLGLVIPTEWLTQDQPLGPLQVETLHRVSLALLIFYAGLKTDLRRIRGMTAAGLRLGGGGGPGLCGLWLWPVVGGWRAVGSVCGRGVALQWPLPDRSL